MPIGFDLTPEQEEVRKQAAEFAEREIAPWAEEVDEKDEFSYLVAAIKKAAQPPHRYAGMFIPKEYDGWPRPLVDACIIMEELAARGSAIGALTIEAAGLPVLPVLIGGSEEQKRKYLPPVARGEVLLCFALTEPECGSDAGAITTRAELVGSEYVLNGRKRYASAASVADYTLIYAKTDPDAGARGISLFIVEKGTPGITVIDKVSCLGMRGHQDEEVLIQDCRIPKENLIGEEGKGFKYAMATLDDTRTTLAAGYTGLARCALEAAVKYAKARKAFGAPLMMNQAISFPLVDIAIGVETARLLTYKAAWLSDQGVRHSMETAMAKAYASEVLLKATDFAVTVHGGIGCTKRLPIERWFRDGKIWTFAQGTPQILRLIVARHLFA